MAARSGAGKARPTGVSPSWLLVLALGAACARHASGAECYTQLSKGNYPNCQVIASCAVHWAVDYAANSITFGIVVDGGEALALTAACGRHAGRGGGMCVRRPNPLNGLLRSLRRRTVAIRDRQMLGSGSRAAAGGAVPVVLYLLWIFRLAASVASWRARRRAFVHLSPGCWAVCIPSRYIM